MELAENGSGYVMFFKLAIWYGFIMVAFSAISVLKAIENVRGTSCTSEDNPSTTFDVYLLTGLPVCVKDWVSIHSVANYGIYKFDNTELSWMLIAMCASWFVLAVYHHQILVTNKEVDRLSDTPSDWTLMVRGLPSDESEDHITRNFEAYGTMGTLPCKVKKVCLAYNSSEYEELEKKVTM